jgi:hypothetical protein
LNKTGLSVVHLIIWERLYRKGVIDTSSGELFIEIEELRRYLGETLRIPRDSHMSVITELVNNNILSRFNMHNFIIKPIDDLQKRKSDLNKFYTSIRLKAS